MSGKLFCLLGKSGAGKDTVFHALMAMPLGLRPVVGYTTRPRRDGEQEGVAYHFVTEETFSAFRAAGKLIEERGYQTVRGLWRYATVDDGSIDLSGASFLMIAAPAALAGLRARFGEEAVVPLYLKVDDGLRLKRMIRREEHLGSPDYEEVCRRFLADCRDFSREALRGAKVEKMIANDRLRDCLRSASAVIRRAEND